MVIVKRNKNRKTRSLADPGSEIMNKTIGVAGHSSFVDYEDGMAGINLDKKQ